jgi:hypothetical protein
MRFGNFVGPSMYIAPRTLAPQALVVVSGVDSNAPGQDRDRLSQALARELIREFGSAHVRVEPYHWTEW